MLSFDPGRMSRPIVSLRWLVGLLATPNQFAVPSGTGRFGSGYTESNAMPFGLCRFFGMIFPGKATPVVGSLMICALLNHRLGPSSSLKLPCFIKALGTVRLFCTSSRRRAHSCAHVKNTLLRSMLYFGMYSG